MASTVVEAIFINKLILLEGYRTKRVGTLIPIIER